jgi:UDP-glucose 4-epimerase
MKRGSFMKIMVTGGAGFIASNVVDGYIKAGHQVVVVDNLSTGKKENVNPAAKLYQMDIRSADMDGLIKTERPDVLNHHAAQISVPVSVADPLLDADINLKGLLNLLERAVKYKVKKFIFISSGGAIYGEATQYPTTEDYPPRPLSPYAVSKLASEYYLAYYSHQYGLDYTILRYANIYGPRQVPHGEAGVVAIFMNNLLKGKRSILNHFPEDNEGMIRDYCYVGDVIKVNLGVLAKGKGEFFNIGTGGSTKTQELYEIIYRAVKEIRPEISEELSMPLRRQARPGDITRSCLRIEKAQKLLGWVPETGLKEGIRVTLQWCSKQL